MLHSSQTSKQQYAIFHNPTMIVGREYNGILNTCLVSNGANGISPFYLLLLNSFPWRHEATINPFYFRQRKFLFWLVKFCERQKSPFAKYNSSSKRFEPSLNFFAGSGWSLRVSSLGLFIKLLYIVISALYCTRSH